MCVLSYIQFEIPSKGFQLIDNMYIFVHLFADVSLSSLAYIIILYDEHSNIIPPNSIL